MVACFGKERKLTVVLKNEADQPVEGKLQYQLRKVGEDHGEYIPPKVTIIQSNNKDGMITLGFTLDESSDEAGEYELTIMVRNKPIANPYKITAKGSIRYYSDFHNAQVTAYKQVGGECYCIAVHSNGTLYASHYDENSIKVFHPNGTETNFGVVQEPWGITTMENNIYVVSRASHVVNVYSNEGALIRSFGRKVYRKGNRNGHLNSPWGIGRDEKRRRILVADMNNKRIQVFTAEGDFVSSIQCSDSPFDVAVDPTTGNIHATLRNTNCIEIYSQDGNKIDAYNIGGNLKTPCGLFIDNRGNRFIGCYDASQVHITDAAGTLIATRAIGSAWGVVTDENGTVYVAESSNNHISIY